MFKSTISIEFNSIQSILQYGGGGPYRNCGNMLNTWRLAGHIKVADYQPVLSNRVADQIIAWFIIFKDKHIPL